MMTSFASTSLAMPGADVSAPAWRRSGLSKSHIPSSKSHIPSPKKVASVELFKGASFLSVKLQTDAPKHGKPPKRGEVHGFTDASRRRMLDLMAKVEVSQVPVF